MTTIRNIDRQSIARGATLPAAVIADGFGNCDIDAEREDSRVGTGLAFCVDCECGAGHLNYPIVVTGIAYRPAVVSNADDQLSDFNSVAHAAASCSKVMDTLRLSASIKRLSRLHRGIEPDVFQLETVLGVRSKAAATAEVPPSVSIMSVAVCIATPYGIRKLAASANYE